jgi:hypothetical protein
MNKLILFLAAIAIMVLSSTTAYATIMGDTNGDGRITSEDANFIARYLTGQFEHMPDHVAHTDEWRRVADVNCDGEISIADVTRLLQLLIGRIATLCPYGGCFRCEPSYNMHQFPGGSGTAEDPFHVSTPQDLNAVRLHLDAHFIQINDIDMTFYTQDPGGLFYNNGAGWEPIGTFESDTSLLEFAFSGVYNGGGYEIIGLYINRTSSRQRFYVGLFSAIRGGEVRNLGMVDGIIIGSISGASTGEHNSQVFAGAISGLMRGGVITNSFNTGTVTASASVDEPDIRNWSRAGGLTGQARYSAISDSHNTGDITAIACIDSIAMAGGISAQTVGQGSNIASHIINCFNTGAIYASNPAWVSQAGGITGYMGYGSITDSHNTGAVEAFTSAGGIVGVTYAITTLTGNTNTGDVTAVHEAGEIYGDFRNWF